MYSICHKVRIVVFAANQMLVLSHFFGFSHFTYILQRDRVKCGFGARARYILENYGRVELNSNRAISSAYLIHINFFSVASHLRLSFSLYIQFQVVGWLVFFLHSIYFYGFYSISNPRNLSISFLPMQIHFQMQMSCMLFCIANFEKLKNRYRTCNHLDSVLLLLLL